MESFPNSSTRRSSMKILVVDDDQSTHILLKKFLGRMGHTVVDAINGKDAIEVFEREHPDMILMDVTMPVMTGYEAATIIKKLSGKHFVPIIFLTSHNDNESLVKCVESGGDDFFIKPFQNVLLEAKILSMQRILQLHQELELFQQQTEEEIALTHHVFDSLTKRMSEIAVPGLDFWMQSAGHFSGDLMIYDKSPSGKLYLMLGDFTGHGFSAAIGAIPTADIFFALTRRDFKLAEIIVEINRKLHEIMPTGHFCAAVFICHDPATNQIEIFNAGLPPVLILDSNRQIINRVESANLALSTVRSERFDPEIVQFENMINKTLVIYSDGVTEARNSQGEYFGDNGLHVSLAQSNSLFDAIRKNLESFIESANVDDDISLITLKL